MSNPTLKTNNSKLDIRVKEPSGVVPPSTSGIGGSPDRFNNIDLCIENFNLHNIQNVHCMGRVSNF